MKNVTLALIFCLLIFKGCTENLVDDEPTYTKTDISMQEENLVEVIPQTPDVDPSTVYPFPNSDCIKCEWYFCPPLDAVWQKQICINN